MTNERFGVAAHLGFVTAAALGLVAFASPLRAQTPPAPASTAPAPTSTPAPAPSAAPATAPVPAPTTPPAPTPAPPGPPAASTGFQMAFRFGVAFPMGASTGEPNDTLGARYAWQVPLALDIGAKLGPSVFVGGYLSYAFGAEGSDTLVEALCDDNDDDFENDISCGSDTFRIGLEVQYHFMPAEKTNFWVGYGAGFETSSESIEDRQQGYEETSSASGFTVAELSGGLDIRSKSVGAGPYLAVAIGRFNTASTEVNGVETASGDIEDPAWHAWLSVGFRLVLFP